MAPRRPFKTHIFRGISARRWRALVLLSWRATASELLCRRSAKMNSDPSFPDALWAYFWSDDGKCVFSGGAANATCGWEANVTGSANWVVESTLQGHTDAVCTVAWSPDGSHVLTGSADGLARIWQTQHRRSLLDTVSLSYDELLSNASSTASTASTAALNTPGPVPIATLRGHTDIVHTVAWSFDGGMALTGSRDGTIRAWRPTNTTEQDSSENSSAHAHASSSAADYRRLSHVNYYSGYAKDVGVNGSVLPESDSTGPFHEDVIEPWSLASLFQGYGDVAWAMKWESNHSQVLVGRHDRTGCLRQIVAAGQRTGHFIARPVDADTAVTACSQSGRAPVAGAHGSTVLRDSYDRNARIWEARWQVDDKYDMPPMWKTQARLQDRHMHAHLAVAVAWSADGNMLLTGSKDGVARIWHAGGAALGVGHDPSQWELMAMLKGHTDVVWAVAWSPDSRYVLTGSRDNVTHIWRRSSAFGAILKHPYQWEVAGTLQEIKCLFTMDHAVDSVFYNGTNMTAEVEGNFLDWEKDKLITLSAVPGAYLVITGHNTEPMSCLTSLFAITCSNGVSSQDQWWEAIGSSDPIDALHQSGGGSGWTAPRVSQCTSYLTADRFAPKLCATDEGNFAFRIQLATQEARAVEKFRRRVASSRFPGGVTADGTKEGLQGDLQRRFVSTPKMVGHFAFRPVRETGHPPAVWDASWSPDGQKVLTASNDGTVRIWTIKAHYPMQWRLTAVLRSHSPGIVWKVAWSPDGSRLATAGHDGLVRIWHNKPAGDLENQTAENQTAVDSIGHEVTLVTTQLVSPVSAGSVSVQVADVTGLSPGMLLTISDGTYSETKVIVSIAIHRRLSSDSRRLGSGSVTVDSPFEYSYAAGTTVVARVQEASNSEQVEASNSDQAVPQSNSSGETVPQSNSSGEISHTKKATVSSDGSMDYSSNLSATSSEDMNHSVVSGEDANQTANSSQSFNRTVGSSTNDTTNTTTTVNTTTTAAPL